MQRQWATVLLVAAVSALTASTVHQASAQTQTAPPLFFDDFENAPVGQLPRGWLPRSPLPTGYTNMTVQVSARQSVCAPVHMGPCSPDRRPMLLHGHLRWMDRPTLSCPCT